MVNNYYLKLLLGFLVICLVIFFIIWVWNCQMYNKAEAHNDNKFQMIHNANPIRNSIDNIPYVGEYIAQSEINQVNRKKDNAQNKINGAQQPMYNLDGELARQMQYEMFNPNMNLFVPREYGEVHYAVIHYHNADGEHTQVPKVQSKKSNNIFNITKEGIDVRAEMKNDMQNVHDSSISSQLSDYYFSRIHKDNIPDYTQDIRNHIINSAELSQDRKSDALEVLDQVKSENVYSGLRNLSESTVLNNMWNKHKSSNNPTNIKDAIVSSLADSKENGHRVCLTGRISRYISSLDGIDDAKPITKSKDVIRMEILNRASKVIMDAIDDCANDPKCSWHGYAKSFGDISVTDYPESETSIARNIASSKLDGILSEYKSVDSNFKNSLKEEILVGVGF